MFPQQLSYDVCRLYLLDALNAAKLDSADRWTLDSILGELRNRRLSVLCSAASYFDPVHHSDHLLGTLLQVEAFFKKNASFAVDGPCRQAALDSFRKGEERCRVTNRRVDFYCLQPERLAPDLKLWISRMQQVIGSVLGPLDDFIRDIPDLVKITSGATAQDSRRKSLPHLKLRRCYSTTSASASHLLRSLATFWGYKQPRTEVRSQNRVLFVPKNWKTYRSVAPEPNGTMPFQLAFDTYCKRRLHQIDVNLRDQSLNQRCALRGSIDSSISTIDLEGASDSLAINVLALLLPYEWFEFLSKLRSLRYTGEAGNGVYSKFSSMGNGMTFALETLVFASACIAVGSKSYAVYGDDIAIESTLTSAVLRLLRFLGFRSNDAKTHTTGFYRESCGEHYYKGISITPYYLRGSTWDKRSMCLFVNSMRSRCVPQGLVWEFLLNFAAKENLHPVPWSEDLTNGIHIDIQESYHLGVLCFNKQRQEMFVKRAYVTKSERLPLFDSRGLFLWYFRFCRPGRGLEDTVASRYAQIGSKFSSKRVRWWKPSRTRPTADLFLWSEELSALLRGPGS